MLWPVGVNCLERSDQPRADRLNGSDDRKSDTNGDEGVFNRGGSALIAQEKPEVDHGTGPLHGNQLVPANCQNAIMAGSRDDTAFFDRMT